MTDKEKIEMLEQRVELLEKKVADLIELITPSKSETKTWNHVD